MYNRPTITAVERTPPPSPSREDDVDELLSSPAGPPPLQPKPPKRKRTTTAMLPGQAAGNRNQQSRRPSAHAKVPVRAASSRFPTPPSDEDVPAGADKNKDKKLKTDREHSVGDTRVQKPPATTARPARAPPSSPELPLALGLGLGLARYRSPELFGSQPDLPVASTSTSISAAQRGPHGASSETALDAGPAAPRRLVRLPPVNNAGPAARGAYIPLSPAGFSNALQSWMSTTANERDVAVSRATTLDATVTERDRVIGALAAELKATKREREKLQADNDSLRQERDKDARRIDALAEVRRGLLGQLDEARNELHYWRGDGDSG